MVTKHLKRCVYEEDTKEYLDYIIVQMNKEDKKQGRKEFTNGIVCFAMVILIFIGILVYLTIMSKSMKYTHPLFYFSLIILIFLLYLLKEDLITLLTTDKLKIYSEGISLPRRTFSEWLKGKEHFIPYKDIKEIVIETHYRTGRPLRVKIVKKDGTVETLGASWFLDLDEFKRVIARQGRVVIREEERFV